jgi:hypothetical protein
MRRFLVLDFISIERKVRSAAADECCKEHMLKAKWQIFSKTRSFSPFLISYSSNQNFSKFNFNSLSFNFSGKLDISRHSEAISYTLLLVKCLYLFKRGANTIFSVYNFLRLSRENSWYSSKFWNLVFICVANSI